MISASGSREFHRGRSTDPVLLGAHMSIAGGVPLAIQRASRIGCTALQIFVKNNVQWNARKFLDSEIKDFQLAWGKCQVRHIVAHSSYLINLASPDDDLWARSIRSLTEELICCERLGLSYLVVHPGSHMGKGEKYGIYRVSQAIDRIHSKMGDLRVHLALETTAGQGTSVGYHFEHLRDIVGYCKDPDKVFVCLDTCHIFAAGYDIRGKEVYLETMQKFQDVIGIDKLKVFHLNDSKKQLGSRVDRHHHIGKGMIGLPGFSFIMNDLRLFSVPKILETPKTETLWHDRRNLNLLRSLVH